MGKKSGSKQLKREPSPGFWPIHRKEWTWATMTRPGPHARRKSLPLVLVLREMLGYAKTAHEAKTIISNGMVSVDGVTRGDHRFPVGLMDVLQIRGINETFRVLPKPGGGLLLAKANDKEATFKVCKVTGKSTAPGGNQQVGLHDGRTLVLSSKDGRTKIDQELSVGSSIQISVPDQKVMRLIPFQPGTIALVTDGKNQGVYGKLAQVTPGTYARRKMVRIEAMNESFETPANYVMPIGTEAPLVTLGEK